MDDKTYGDEPFIYAMALLNEVTAETEDHEESKNIGGNIHEKI